jgi:hypothetical protein
MKAYLIVTKSTGPTQSGVKPQTRFLLLPDFSVYREDNGDGTFNFEIPNVNNRYGANSRQTVTATTLSVVNSILDVSTVELLCTVDNGISQQPPLKVIVGTNAIIACEGQNVTDSLGTTGVSTIYVRDTNAKGSSLEVRSLVVATPIATLMTTLYNPLNYQGQQVALNSTGAITSAMIAGRNITTTSAAATTGTLPSAALLFVAANASVGSSFELTIDNHAGANTFTLALGSGTSAESALTGGTTLTVTTAEKVGVFRIYFPTTTTAIVSRIV